MPSQESSFVTELFKIRGVEMFAKSKDVTTEDDCGRLLLAQEQSFVAARAGCHLSLLVDGWMYVCLQSVVFLGLIFV